MVPSPRPGLDVVGVGGYWKLEVNRVIGVPIIAEFNLKERQQ